MRIELGSELIIHDVTEQFYHWVAENYTIPNPEYNKLARLGRWTGGTPKKLWLFKKQGSKIILPYGTAPTVFRVWNILDYDYQSHNIHRIDYEPKPMGLRPYQKKAWLSLMNNYVGILEAPAGSGKTQVGLALIFGLKRKALWLTHTKDLVEQTYNRALQFVSPDLVSKTLDGKLDISDGLTVATVQTMSKMNLDELRNEWDVIIVDECHRCAGTPAQMKMFTKVLSKLYAPNKYGLSATLHRADGLIPTTLAYLGPVVHSIPKEEVESYVLPVEIVKRYTGTGITEECLDTDGTIIFQKLITHLVTDEKRNRLIAADLLTNRYAYNLVLSVRISHLEEIAKLLPEGEYRIVTGNTKAAEREQSLAEIREGKIHYLLSTFALAKEGLDIPRLSNVYLTTPQKDYAIVTQSIGRVARICDGKTKATAYDYVDRFQYAEKCWKARLRHYKKGGCILT